MSLPGRAILNITTKEGEIVMTSTSPPTQFDHLCQECKALQLGEDAFLRRPDSSTTEWTLDIDWELQDEWPDFTKALKRAEGDCAFCRTFGKIVRDCAGSQHIAKLLEERPESGTQFRASLCYVMGCEDGGQVRLKSIRIKGDFNNGETIKIDCPIAAASTSTNGHPSSLGFAEPLNHLNPDYLTWMKSEIDSCVDHGHFKPQNFFVPDRLIKVNGDILSLVLTKDMTNLDFHPPQGTDLSHYTALTYCWGAPPHSDKQLKTTSENLARHLSEIPSCKLPQTIKDAVAATRALSISYLWVDSLCIIQDQGSDWEYQCTQMDRIYGNARVTICALANNCEEGFVERKDKISIPFKLQDTSKAQGAFSIYQPSYHRTLIDDITFSNWILRGWTFQERSASTRILFFGASNVHFQCSKGQSTTSEYENLYEFEMVRRDLLDKSGPDELYRQWNVEVASEFTLFGFEFTRAADVLPSLAGLAALFAGKLQDRYLAGLWENDFHRSLSWYMKRSDRPSYDRMLDNLQHPSPYIAPSWSWTSRSSLVSFEIWGEITDASAARLECTKLDATVALAGASPFGELTGGYLDVSGNFYAGSRRLTWVEARDFPFVVRETLQLDGQYLLDFGVDCDVMDVFVQSGESYELDAPISLLMIGSTVSKPHKLWDNRQAPLTKRDKVEDESSQLSGSEDIARSDGSSPPRESWDERSGAYLDRGKPQLINEESEPQTAQRRLAYGLLIHPAEKPGEFYRIGNFISNHEGLGGLEFFESCETKTIRLV